MLETLGPEEYIPVALFLLAEKGRQMIKTAITEFGADLLNSFPLETRLRVSLDLNVANIVYGRISQPDCPDSSRDE